MSDGNSARYPAVDTAPCPFPWIRRFADRSATEASSSEDDEDREVVSDRSWNLDLLVVRRLVEGRDHRRVHLCHSGQLSNGAKPERQIVGVTY
jgi:hypothetical protein